MFLHRFRRVCPPIAVVVTATFLSALLPARSAQADPIAPSRGTGGSSSLAGPSTQSENANGLASVDLATGSARATLPFDLPRARGTAQPSLPLTYSSNAGVGYAGVGWTIDLPSIERKGVAGRPRYIDNRSPTDSEFAQDDRFLFNHRPLVPICTLDGSASCNRLTHTPGERFPRKLAGWTYYRAEVDDGVRLFFSPTGDTWLAQTKDGQELLFGNSVSGDGAPEAVERADNSVRHPDSTTRIHRWNLIEQTDASLNTVYYVWQYLQKTDYARSVLFLTDIYDTAPPKRQGAFDRVIFAHHTHLRWSAPDGTATTMSRTPIWRAQPTLRLLGVDVTSSPPNGSGPRELVRRYHLDYSWNTTQTRASLSSFQLEGRCGGFVEGPTNQLPAVTGCPRQPATTMTYTQPKPGPSPVNGPGFSSKAGNIALLDINGDAIPEVLSFDPQAPPPNDTMHLDSQTLNDSISLQANAARVATIADLAPGAKRVIYGDWIGDGRLDFLWLNINPRQFTLPPPNNTFETYSFDSRSKLIGIGPAPLDVDPNRVPVRLGLFDATSEQAIDIDGDGLVDLGFLDGPGNRTTAFLSQRKPTGGVYPFGERIDRVCTRVTRHQGLQAADFDGDGLADLISVNGGTEPGSTFGPPLVAHVYRGRGDGRFGAFGPAPNDCDLGHPADDFHILNANIGADIFQSNLVAFHDVSGDGLADVIVVNRDFVYVGLHSRTPGDAAESDRFTTVWKAFAPLDFGIPRNFDPTTVSLLFGDMDASGTEELLLGSGTFHHIVDFVGPTPAGFLQSINNGVGVTTTIDYDTVAHATKTSTAKLPVPAQVVTKTTTTNGLTGAQLQSYVASYTYEEPLYDARDRLFVGFNKVSVDRPGDAAAPGLLTTTTFVPSTCSVAPTQPCAGLIDYVYRAFRGLPAVVEQFAEGVGGAPGAHLTTLVSTFQFHNAYLGTDGRGVRQIWPAQNDLYLWNPSEQGSTSPSRPVVIGDTGQSIFVPVTIPDKGAHLRRARELDFFGDETASIDFGLFGVDTPIRVERDWDLVVGEASAWQRRKHDERVAYSDMQGASMIAPVRTTHFDYEGRALLTQVSAPLSGTLPLGRQNNGPFAPPPADASVDAALIARATIGYDNFGNVGSIQMPNGRCRAEAYDAAFQQLPVTTTLYKNGCGSANPLVTSRRMDRGFAVVTSELSPALEMTITKYDGFGRVLEIDQPDATMSGTTAPLPALIVDYSGADHGGPVRKILSQRVLAGSGRDAYASTWQYVDGFGRTLATLRSTEVQNRWLVEGATKRSTNGRVISAFESFFFQGSGIAFPVDQAISQRSVGFTYDQLGRVLAASELGGGPGTVRSYNANVASLSVTITDAEQRPGGTHTGSFTTIASDGLGRVKQKIRHVEAPARDDIITTNTFLASGELDTAVQEHSANPADRVLRQLQYDSFGRLVQNSEPNTGLWRYAYNDSGDLVGTSDPRGCGENLSYDGLGRLAGEDYSPCTNTQHPYSLPNPSTGDGYEALYRFDVPEVSVGFEDVAYVGRLAATADRAQHMQVVRDARGRAVGVRRQLAKPGGAGLPLATRYTPNWFSRSISYDEGDRPVSTSTGADAAELQVQGASEVTTSFTPRGTVDTVSGSYGLLFTQEVAANGNLTRRVLGDAASTTTDYGYDANGRLGTLQIHRRPGTAQGGAWLAPSSTYSPPDASDHTLEAELATYRFTYDLAGNPTKITDGADPGAWQTGSLPASTRSMTYDDSYRMTRTDVAYAGGDDTFVSPYRAEERRGDTTFPTPSPVSTNNRVRWQTVDYDWLGSIRTTDDDAHDFPDRSTGTAALGQGPHQFYSSFSSGGQIKAQYDHAGNVTDLFVQRTAGCAQNCVTNYSYVWDELGRLEIAGRVETGGTGQQVTALRVFAYDASGNRVRERTVDPTSGTSTYNATIFDSLRLEHASYPDANGDYEHTALTESVYLKGADGTAIARVVHDASAALPTGASGSQHVFFELGDHLGSTSFVIDRDTGELVERAAYQAYGGAESDFRPDRWSNFREGHRYTDHEDDAEVGLVYFGQRYYAPIIGRWVSPDPVNVHALGSDPNPYAFVRGSPFRYVDPVGLDPCSGDSCPPDLGLIGFAGGVIGIGLTFVFGSGGGSGGGSGSRNGGRGTNAPPVKPPPVNVYGQTAEYSRWSAEHPPGPAPEPAGPPEPELPMCGGSVCGDRIGPTGATIIFMLATFALFRGTAFSAERAAQNGWEAFLPEAERRTAASAARFGANDAVAVLSQDARIAQHVFERGHYPGMSVAQIEARVAQLRATGQPYTAPNGNVLYRSGNDILIDNVSTGGGSMFQPDNVLKFIQTWLEKNP